MSSRTFWLYVVAIWLMAYAQGFLVGREVVPTWLAFVMAACVGLAIGFIGSAVRRGQTA